LKSYLSPESVGGTWSQFTLDTEGAGHGMLTANELEVEKVGGLFCPATSKWTALYEPLEHLYILGGEEEKESAPATQLCSVHDSLVCPGDHEVEEFTAKAGTTVLKTNLATVLCLTSKVTAEVEGELLDNPLKVLLSELDFLECGTNSEHNNCTVTVEQLPLLTVSKTRLNVGTVTVNKELPAEINVKCGKIINCTYSEPVGGKSFAVEGALDWTDSKMCRHPRLI